jgi:hypothetical protein
MPDHTYGNIGAHALTSRVGLAVNRGALPAVPAPDQLPVPRAFASPCGTGWRDGNHELRLDEAQEALARRMIELERMAHFVADPAMFQSHRWA